MTISLTVNNTPRTIDIADENTPLLWVIRDMLGLKGTKFGCGKAACGACTLHVDGEAIRSCSYAVKFAAGKRITTIEGLGNAENPHPVQQAWIEKVVPQCGYCQPGFMMATAALLEKVPHPTDEDIDKNIINVCRCATYYRMRKAIHRAAELKSTQVLSPSQELASVSPLSDTQELTTALPLAKSQVFKSASSPPKSKNI